MATEEVQSRGGAPLDEAIEAVKEDPTNPGRWDDVEELLETDQRPTDVSALFKRVLTDELSPEQATDIGQRGVRFYETWYGEDSSDLPALLERVLQIDPGAQWAFERLTVAYTVSERWDALLDAYDLAIERADQTARRMQLLDEAGQAAKDFANQPDRAIGYMQKLYALDPQNSTLASSLERLLERQERWLDLIALWESRLSVQSAKHVRDARIRMAQCYLQKVGDAGNALEQAKLVLADSAEYAPALAVLESVLADERATGERRREALELLKQHFIRKKKPKEVVRVLESGLVCTEGAEQRAFLRELVERLCDLGEDARAMGHQAALLLLEPMPGERDALRVLAERTHDYGRYAEALVAAADACAQPQTSIELLMEAARTREQALSDEQAAIELYQRVFNGDAAREVIVEAGRNLVRLLEKTDREQETLAVLSRMSELEPEDAVRSSLLGKVARLAERQGDAMRAHRAWQARLDADAEDVEALDALIAAVAEAEQWPALAELLAQRVRAPGAADRRREDMVWLAGVYADRLGDLARAIEVWNQVLANYGEDTESVSALTELLSRAERWQELASVLSRAAGRQTERFTELQSRLGDAYRERLDQPEQAALRYRSALQVDPTHAGARAGQVALLEDERCKAIAIESLAGAYAHTDEWQNTLGLLEARLSIEDGTGARADILIEAAELFEEQANDLKSALSCLARAFALIPDDRATEKEIRRLAERLDAWEAVVQAYRDTIASFPHVTPRAAELRFDEGRTLEQHLGDKEAALEAYAAAASITPDRLEFTVAATRLCAQLGRLSDAVGHVLACVSARDVVEPALIEALEGAAVEGDAWDALTEAMSTGLAKPPQPLGPALARDLQRCVARWHRDKRNDEDAAELALVRAMQADASDAQTLRALAELQRRAPGEGLVDTLLALFATDEQNLDPLLEAAEVARSSGLEASRAQALDERLFEAGASLFSRNVEALGEATAPRCVHVALERLVSGYRAAGDHKRAMELSLRAADLPFEVDFKREFRRQAAGIAAGDLHDNLRAIALYRDLWQVEPGDRQALAALAELYQAEDRLPELLMLRRHQLEHAPDDEQRLSLRLEIASLLGEMEARGGRVDALTENLRVRPGHAPTIEALGELLRARGRITDLAALFEQQAAALGETPDAAGLLRRAAALYERELSDPEGAVRAYRALHEVEPEGDASESLARIFMRGGDHAEAARWLELRLGTAPPDTRAITAVELARAHLEAGHRERARGCLEQALHEEPTLAEGRELLAGIYRSEEAWEPLARMLVDGAKRVQDPAARLGLLTEAANLYYDTLKAPERAVEALEQASELAPSDHALHARLAEALRRARRYEEAQAVLERLISAFGRKRSAERAELHFQLARVLKDAGHIDGAFEQLEQATKMDLTHAAALHMLAALSQEQGDLDRAERAYRGLLLLVRRQQSDEASDIGPAEVSFELSRIAVKREQEDQAQELLESAMEAAMQSELEARRFQRLLRDRGEVELLTRLLDARLSRAQDHAAEAEILASKADVLAGPLGRPQEALEAMLKAMKLDPERMPLHVQACKVAVSLGELDRYLESVNAMVEEAQRKRGKKNQRLAVRLTLRMGEVIEQELRDLDRAAGLYAKVEASGELTIEAWMALARVSGARGDKAEQRRVLAKIADLGPDQVTKEQRQDALFALAQVELESKDHREAGVASLKRALDLGADADRAKAMLREAVAKWPEDGRVEQLFERVARDSHDDSMLIEHFERLSTGGAPPQDVREGVELALRIGEIGRAEMLLMRAADQVRSLDEGRASGAWVFAMLGESRRRAGDIKRAIACMVDAVEVAEGHEAESLARDLAKLAAGPNGDLEIAARVYEDLLDRERGDRTLWEPLLDVYSRLGDAARFDGFADRCVEYLAPAERAVVHIARARFMMQQGEDRSAIRALKALLDDVPGNIEATDLLTKLYQKHDMNDELAELLLLQFDRARDERNVEAVAELGLRVGELYGERRPEEAIDAYRAALEWAPEHEGLLRALLLRLGPGGPPRDRAEVMHTLLRGATGDEAALLARQLCDLWKELAEDERALSALELGLERCPENEELQGLLEVFYFEKEMWRPLAELLERDAERVGGGAGVGRLKNAATLYRENLGDLEAAAGALRKALKIVPEDLSLLGELARNLSAAGQSDRAIEDVSTLLDEHPALDAGRVDLLKVRADLYLGVERLDDAVTDLDAAYKIARKEVAGRLIQALEMQKTTAFTAGNAEAERRAVMRLIEIHDQRRDADSAREALAGWVEQDPRDAEALHELRRRDLAAERWDDVALSCERLIDIETGDARAEAAIGLADALQHAGRAEDARGKLEEVQREAPEHAALRERLRSLYESIGARSELATILLADAQDAAEVSEQIALYQRAAQLFLEMDDAPSALGPLSEASKRDPEDERTKLLLIDIYTRLGRLDEATQMLETGIEALKGRRSPELATLYQRHGRVLAMRGDNDGQLKYLSQALETDRRSGEIAAELAEAAIALAQYDAAMKALRSITMMDDPQPITRAMAFLKQAQIAQVRGDPRRAQHWARKAKSLDESLAEADAFLAEIGD